MYVCCHATLTKQPLKVSVNFFTFLQCDWYKQESCWMYPENCNSEQCQCAYCNGRLCKWIALFLSFYCRTPHELTCIACKLICLWCNMIHKICKNEEKTNNVGYYLVRSIKPTISIIFSFPSFLTFSFPFQLGDNPLYVLMVVVAANEFDWEIARKFWPVRFEIEIPFKQTNMAELVEEATGKKNCSLEFYNCKNKCHWLSYEYEKSKVYEFYNFNWLFILYW